jgi:3-oxoacyl-[acyl-carrier protein] reductase
MGSWFGFPYREQAAMGDRFGGRVAVVTGSTKGIGKACAARLATEGAAVVLNARSRADLEQAAKELAIGGARVATYAGDVTEDGVPAALVEAACKQFGRIDLLVSTIGLSPYFGSLLEIDPSSFKTTMTANTWVGVALLQAALQAGLGRGGAMVNISAIGTRKLFVPAGAYLASKAALDVLTRLLALEAAPRGVRVNGVAPGLIRTAATERLLSDPALENQQAAAVPLGRVGEPNDIAGAVAFLLSDDAAYVTGTVLDVDGGALLSAAGFQPDS